MKIDRQAGFSLMELIGVMAVMAILAGTLTPNIADSINQAYSDAEQQNLVSIGDSLKHYIVEQKRIPTANPAQWVPAIATDSGFTTEQIEFNHRDYRRRLIFDPRFFTTTDTVFPGLTQNQGLATAPVSPRVMIVSDLTRNVPAVTNSTAAFNDIWNQTNTPELVESDNVIIERINLSDKFHRVIFSNQNTAQPFYQLEAGANTAIPAAVGGLDGSLTRFIIHSTRISLYANPFPTGSMQQMTVLQNSLGMRFETDGVNWNWVKQ